LGQLGIDGEELAKRAGIDPKLRAQNLTIDDFCNLSDVYEKLKVI
jgi:16S rRNA A1518/A1519 N6-dimethyltransferase RsmA/KsgA/DIM1 with predicted DNA glycosylase/AP lyase activity